MKLKNLLQQVASPSSTPIHHKRKTRTDSHISHENFIHREAGIMTPGKGHTAYPTIKKARHEAESCQCSKCNGVSLVQLCNMNGKSRRLPCCLCPAQTSFFVLAVSAPSVSYLQEIKRCRHLFQTTRFIIQTKKPKIIQADQRSQGRRWSTYTAWRLWIPTKMVRKAGKTFAAIAPATMKRTKRYRRPIGKRPDLL